MNRLLKTQLVNTSSPRPSGEESFCKYGHHDCMLPCVEGFEFCIRHILEDKMAPFKQCAYMTKSGRRCSIAALKQDRKDGFCHEHARKAVMGRQRFSRKRRPNELPETLVEELAASNSGTGDSVNHDTRRSRANTDSLASKALEYASSTDSETETLLVESAWRDDGDSDAESIDSDQGDMLKYAGVYSTEEVAQILRDKLIRLQALYIDQFRRLRHQLQTKRRKYLRAKAVEQERYGSVKLYKNDPYQKKKYNKLCAMKRYHQKYGKEALLQHQSTQRRMKASEGLNHQPPTFPKCVFVDEGLQCCARVVPLSKFCQKHILHDPLQVLYRPCPFADSQCGRPVPTLFNMEFCSLHQRIKPLKEPEASDPVDVKPDQESLDQPSCSSGVTEVKAEVTMEEIGEPETKDVGEGEGMVLFTLGEEEEDDEEMIEGR